MGYVFDPVKGMANRAKHGVSLALAQILSSGPYVSREDDRFEYGKLRKLAFGFIKDRRFACVFADREAERRVISLRKANIRDVTWYCDDIK